MPLQWFSVTTINMSVLSSLCLTKILFFYSGKVSKSQIGGKEHEDWEEKEVENENIG